MTPRLAVNCTRTGPDGMRMPRFAIAINHARDSRKIGKRYVGVWSKQVQSIAGQSGRICFGRQSNTRNGTSWSAHQAERAAPARPYT